MVDWFQKRKIGAKKDKRKKEVSDDNNRKDKSNVKKFRYTAKYTSRKGSTVITDVFILVISLLIMTITTMFMVNVLTPFIYYQKLQMTSQKYMYIIEKYGSLTNVEVGQMYDELKKQGFQRDKLKIIVPKSSVSYGDEIIFEVEYIHNQKVPTLNGGINIENKEIAFKIRKVSISKK